MPTRGSAYTREDLATMPDDGRRYELVDGTLIVTPAPSRRHQDVAANLYDALSGPCPRELKARFAPVDVAIADDTVLQPDLLVVRRDEYSDDTQPLRPCWRSRSSHRPPASSTSVSSVPGAKPPAARRTG